MRAALLNALWLAGSLLGAVVLGIGPSTVAAYTLARRFARGEGTRPVRCFAHAYRQEAVRGNTLVLPPLAVAAILWTGSRYLASSALPGATVASLACLTALLLVAVGALYVVPIAVHYEVPVHRTWTLATAFALTHLPGTIVLGVSLAAIGYASSVVPGLLPLLSVGAWILLNMTLCVRFFAENDAALGPTPDERTHPLALAAPRRTQPAAP